MNEELVLSFVGKIKNMVNAMYSESFTVEQISIEGDKATFNVDTDNRSKVFTFTTSGDLVSLTDWEK
jgi:hypothetical protein